MARPRPEPPRSAPAQAASDSSTASSPPPSTIAPPTTIATAALQGDAAELAAAIDKATTLTYDARYDASTTDANGTTATQVVEIWRQGSRARRDTVITSDQGSLHTEEFRLTDQMIGCIDTNTGGTTAQFTCVPTEGRGVDPGDPLIGVARPVNGSVTARDDHVGSLAVRCFDVATADGTQEACFDGDGIPVVIDGGDGRLMRQSVSREVEAATFEPPHSATPAGPTPPTTTGGA